MNSLRNQKICLKEFVPSRVICKNFPEKRAELSKDVYIFHSCFNHNFIRKVLERNTGVQPIMMGESEYGQYGFSKEVVGPKEDLLYAVIGAGGTGSRESTVKTVMDDQRFYKTSNFTIYVPGDDKPQQII